MAGPEPTAEFAAEMVEAVDRLFDQLADDELRQIALHKLEGYTNEEIAQEDRLRAAYGQTPLAADPGRGGGGRSPSEGR